MEILELNEISCLYFQKYLSLNPFPQLNELDSYRLAIKFGCLSALRAGKLIHPPQFIQIKTEPFVVIQLTDIPPCDPSRLFYHFAEVCRNYFFYFCFWQIK